MYSDKVALAHKSNVLSALSTTPQTPMQIAKQLFASITLESVWDERESQHSGDKSLLEQVSAEVNTTLTRQLMDVVKGSKNEASGLIQRSKKGKTYTYYFAL